MLALICFGALFSVLLAAFKLSGVFTWPWWMVAAPYAITCLLWVLNFFYHVGRKD